MTAYIKHSAGECWFTADEVIVTWEGFGAPPSKKAASPLRARLSEVILLERDVTFGGDRTERLRIFTPLHAGENFADDPWTLNIRSVRGTAQDRAEAFVRDAAKSVSLVTGRPVDQVLLTVKNLKHQPGALRPASRAPDVAPQSVVPVLPSQTASPVADPQPVQAMPPPVGPPLKNDPAPSQPVPTSSRGTPAAAGDVGIFGARGKARELQSELAAVTAQRDWAHAELNRLGALDAVTLQLEIEGLRQQVSQRRLELAEVDRQLAALRERVIATTDMEVLQEVGVYEYTHPLDDAVQFRAVLDSIKERIRMMNRADGNAVEGSTNWSVNGSLPKGRKLVREFSKLLLRAYNNEADNLVRTLKPYKLVPSAERLTKAKETIERLGATMDIRVNPEYHGLRLEELSLTADYLNRLAVEREMEREERERLREERRAQLEMERAREKLDNELAKHQYALKRLRAQGDVEAIARMEAEIAEIKKAIMDVAYRQANLRAGFVYVISNIGSFGERMVKIGMTRRQEPRDRVRELSDASVPFNFDLHAIHFSKDAVGVETQLHQRFSDRRVNLVNTRREFFYVTPSEVRDAMIDIVGDLLEFNEVGEAAEFHQSINQTRRAH